MYLAIVTLFRNPITIIPGRGATYMAPTLAAWTGLFLPVFVATSHWSGKRLRASGGQARRAREELSSLLGEQLLGSDVIRDFQAEDDEHGRFSVLNQRDCEARVNQEVDRILPGMAVRAAGAVGIAALLWLGASQVRTGALLPGQLLAFIAALGLLLKPIAGMAEVWGWWNRSMASLERVHAVLDLPVSSSQRPHISVSAIPRIGAG